MSSFNGALALVYFITGGEPGKIECPLSSWGFGSGKAKQNGAQKECETDFPKIPRLIGSLDVEPDWNPDFFCMYTENVSTTQIPSGKNVSASAVKQHDSQ